MAPLQDSDLISQCEAGLQQLGQEVAQREAALAQAQQVLSKAQEETGAANKAVDAAAQQLKQASGECAWNMGWLRAGLSCVLYITTMTMFKSSSVTLQPPPHNHCT
jgi:uncharacterized membrane protein YccC